MSAPNYRDRLHNAPPTLSALLTSNEAAFRRACADRHHANRERWIRDREPAVINREVARLARAVLAAFGR